MKRYFIYGAGGHGKVVLDALQLAKLPCDGFVDCKNLQTWCSHPVINENALNQKDIIHIAIGNGSIRQRIVSTHSSNEYFSIIHPNATVAKTAKTSGFGTFIAANAVVGPDAIIEAHCIINHGAIVDHDCKVGKFCHVAPNAVLGGGSTIGENVMVGAGAVILPGLTICNNVIIGAGAVVTKDILAPQTVIGVPAKNIHSI